MVMFISQKKLRERKRDGGIRIFMHTYVGWLIVFGIMADCYFNIFTVIIHP